MKLNALSLLILFPALAFAGPMPIQDNILLAFDRCKSLTVDLKTGQWQESYAPSFDIHCRKLNDEKIKLNCDFFATDSSKKLFQETYQGGSELGAAEFVGPEGKKIKFLIGHKYASFESPLEKKVCAGIYIFEKEALKKKKQEN